MRVRTKGMMAALALLAPMTAGTGANAAQQPEEKVFEAPGFADFLMVDGDTVWATNRGHVERWSLEGKIAEVPMPKPCGAMALDGHDMWVADCQERTINRIDTRTQKIVATVATGLGAPNGELSTVAGGGAIWVTSDAAGTISRVDPETNAVVATIPVDPNSFYLTYAYGALWAVSDTQQSIQKIDPQTNTVVKRASLGRQSSFSAAGDGAIWVVEQGDGSIARVDAQSGEVTGRVKVADKLPYSDIDTGGGKVWVRTRVGQIFVVIDPGTMEITARVGKEGQGGGGLRYTKAGLWTTQHDVHLLSWWPDPDKIGN